MKNKIISFLLILAICSSFNVFALSEEEKYVLNDETDKIESVENTTVKIHESEEIREFDDKMCGLCWEFQEFSNTNILGGGTDISDEYKAIAKKLKNSFTLARVAGSPSSWYFYSDNVGPIKQRKSRKIKKFMWDLGDNAVIETSDSYVANFGPSEWIKAAYEINPDTEFIVTLNIVTADTLESQKTAAFFTAEEGVTVDGVDWGKIRKESGIEKPVKIAMYELGNEIPWSNFKYCSRQGYVDTVKAHIAAVREIDPNAKFAYCGAMIQNWETGPDGMDWRQWTYDVYPHIADECEYVTFHPYHSGTGLATYDKYLNNLTNDQLESAGKNAKHVYTEVAKWPGDTEGNSKFGYNFSQDPIMLDGALADAIFLNRMYMRDDVYGATYFLSTEYPNGCWGIFKMIDGKLRITGPGYMYNLYTHNTGGTVVNNEVEGSYLTDVNDDRCRFSVLAAKQGKDTLKLIIVNRSPYVKHNIDFEFENKYTLVEETTFTAPNINSYVCSEATNDIFKTVTEEKNIKNFTSYEMPNKTMTVLTLKSDKPFVYAGNEDESDGIPDAENKFDDMQGHWAENIVAAMNEKGIVTGNENGNFNPDGSITRAELAKILSLAAKAEISENPIPVFEDMTADSWYAPYVEAAYENGLIRGKSGKIFAPDDTVTMEELAAVAARIKGKNTVVSEIERENILRGFKFRNKISQWAENDVLIAVKCGALERLYENGNFDPNANATRAQAVSVINEIYR